MGKVNCNGSLCGLGFLSAWWPQGDETFSMADQDSKVGVPVSKVEFAWLPITWPLKPLCHFPCPCSKQPQPTWFQGGGRDCHSMQEYQRVCSQILQWKFHSLSWYQLPEGLFSSQRGACALGTLAVGAVTDAVLSCAGNTILIDSHRTSDPELGM